MQKPASDVKKIPESSTEKTTDEPVNEPEEKNAKPAETEQEVSLDDNDLENFSESRKIPYSRFKEVNEKAKNLEKQMQDMKASQDVQIQRAIEDAEIRLKARLEKEQQSSEGEYVDPYEQSAEQLRGEIADLKGELTGLKSEYSQTKVENQLSKLLDEYPEADKLSVLGWKKVSPDSPLEELVAMSHEQNSERIEKGIRKLINAKKEKAKTRLPGSSTNRFKMDESEKPKTIQDATAMIKKMLSE